MKVLFTSISFLVLSLLLASCGGGGGSDKGSGSSGSKDEEGPASAPTATAPTDPVGGASYNLAIVCNEAAEVVSITGKGLEPDPQTHTCTGSGAEEFSLSLKQGVHLPSPNNLSLSSMDEHGNSAGDTTIVNVPIDTLAPSVAITNGGDIIEGSNASFTITVTDDSDFVAFTPEVSSGSGSVTSGACLSSPCSVVVSGALVGTLTLTVAAGGVVDAAGNANASEVSNSLNVGATTLSVTSAPMGTSLNAASYEVMGTCVANQGDVTVTVETASPVTVDCTGDPGTYTALLDISGVTANPMSVIAEQSGNTKSLSPSPANDQQGPASAPTATAPAGPVGGGTSYNLPIVCTEAAEVVSITGSGLNPDPQTHTCTNSGAENFSLILKEGVSFPSVNNLTLNSTDQYGNPASGTTTVNVPIDTLAPSVAITNGGDIIEGNNANFTITVTDDSDFVAFTPGVSSGSGNVTSGVCSSSPCSVVVSGTTAGTLTLTVAAGGVVDAAGNANAAEASDSLTVIETTLSVTSAPMGTSLNAASYPVSGNCDVGEGDVTVTVENASPVIENCTGDPGTYTASLDISGVAAGSMSVMAEQGGRMESLSPSPANDQNGPTSAPMATAPAGPVGGGASYNLSILCNEAAEVVSITGSGLNPDSQTHTCTGSGAEDFSLILKEGVSFPSVNNLTLNSTDQYGNPASGTTTVNVPIDTLAPSVAVANGGDIIEGNNANFTITVTDDSDFVAFTPEVSSGSVTSGVCSSSPCSVVVSEASVGTLTLTVAAGDVVDAAGNSNASEVSNSLNVGATTLSVTSALMGTSLNATSYPVSGNCDVGQGDVTVTVENANPVPVDCTGDPGNYTALLDISEVTADPMSVTATQGGNTKNFSPSPANDQKGPASAPMATAPTGPVGGASYNLSILCNEAAEVVSITGKGLEPDPQTHTCAGSGAENFLLSLKQGVSFPSPNNLTLNSKDQYENPAGGTTIVNVPIDTLAPSVAITNGGNITEGDNASFTITVTDDSDFVAFTPEISNGSVRSGDCLSSPCSVVVSGALAGTLTLTVAAGDVVDAAGNANTAEVSDSLTVIATTLSVTSASMGTSLNAASYPVSGNCVASQGTVTVTVETASPVMATCTGDPGNYTALLDISGVTANPLSVMVEQSGNTRSLSPSPANDQNGPASAPMATAPAGPVGGGASYNLPIDCNEAGEVVSITGSGLNPDSQTHTCTGSGAETFSLSLKQGVSFPSVNNLTLNSTDQYGNPAEGTTIVNVPIDTLAPSVAITNGGNIIERNNANFTITVTDDSDFVAFTPEVSNGSGSVTSGTCSSSPCSVVVSGTTTTGTLTLTVAAGDVVDAAGNANTAEVSNSLTVIATTLSVTSAPTGTSLNAASYPVSGHCDVGEGDVTVTVETASPVTAECTGDPGTYTASLDISGVAAGSMSVMAEQGGRMASFSPNPLNDQNGPISAPMATAPAGPVGGGASYNLPIVCNEAAEVVSITGSGLNPDPQTHTCTGSGAEDFSLILKQGVNFPSPNNLTLNSKDQYGNPAEGTTIVNVPIDTLAPSVAITNGGDIIEGNNASFTVVVMNDSDFVAFTPEVSSGNVTSGVCSSSPCSVVVSEALVGTLTLTVAAGAVVDAAGNANTAEVSNSLTVIATTLSVTSALTGTSLNAASYPVSGNCDVGEGDVTVTAGNC